MFLHRWVSAAVLRCLCILLSFPVLGKAAVGDLSLSYQPSIESASCMALQPDGKALVVSGSNPLDWKLTRLLKITGQQDPFFNTTVDGRIRCIAVQPDGKILIGGEFTNVTNILRRRVARLMPDGSLDLTFNPDANGSVSALFLMADGSVLLGGEFTGLGGVVRNRVAKISPNGTVDAFAPSLDGPCAAIEEQADGQILLGGEFTTVNGMARAKLARVSAEGILDAGFTPTPLGAPIWSGGPTWVSEQPDGKILVTALDTNSQNRMIGRLMPSGAPDPSFQFAATSSSIHTVSVQADGKLLLGGSLTFGNTMYQLARINADGSLDPTFAVSGIQYGIQRVVPTNDGAVLVAGDLVRVGSTSVHGVARILSTPMTSSLVVTNASTIEWLRSGATAQLKRVTFEHRSEEGEWTLLGEGQAIPGGWRIDAINVPTTGVIRARGTPMHSGDISIHEGILSIGNRGPILTVRKGGTVIPSGGPLNLGTLVAGAFYDLDFEITNSGDKELHNIYVSNVDISPPGNLKPGETAQFRLKVRASGGFLTGSFQIFVNGGNNPIYNMRFFGDSSSMISPVFRSPTDIPLTDPSAFSHESQFGELTLEFAPEPGTVLTVVKNYSIPELQLSDLPDGAIVSADFDGTTYQFVAGYRGNLGGDLTLTLLGDGVIEKSYIDSTVPLYHEVAIVGRQGDGSFYIDRSRWDVHGVVDPVYSNTRYGTAAILVQPNGEHYFVSGPGPDGEVLRLRNDGTLDESFHVSFNSYVTAIASQPDGKIIIGGGFSSVNGQDRKGLARLHRDGTLDESFQAEDVYSPDMIVVEPDGSILIRDGSEVSRYGPDGTKGITFYTNVGNATQILRQPDGKIVVIGSGIDNDNPKFVRRYHPDGTLDSGFNLETNGEVQAMALQADGKFLISGKFTKVGDYRSSGVARIHADGTLDQTFFGWVSSSPGKIIIGTKNEIHLVSGLGDANGVSAGMARLSNPTAADHIEVVNGNTVRWMREGGAAELQWVTAELIPETTGEPVSLGIAQRIAGGWEVISPTPISNATVRLSGPAVNSAGMIVLVEESIEVGTVTPRLIVTTSQEVIPSDEVYDLGRSILGMARSILMRLENRGAGILQSPSVSIEGTNAEDFSVIQSSPADLGADEQRSFRINFRPTGVGVRTAQLIVANSDPSLASRIIELRYDSRNTIDPVFNSASDIGLTLGNYLDATTLNLGTVTLGFAPTPGTILTVVANVRYLPIYGTFSDLPDQSYISIDYEGVTYQFLVNYDGGSASRYDVVLRLVGVGDVIPGFLAGLNGPVYGLAIQPDGKALIGGNFTKVGAATANRLARLHPDGSLDTSFNASANQVIESIILLDDERILIGGGFDVINGATRQGLACLNHDGSLSPTFNFRAEYLPSVRASVIRMLKLKSGKVLVSGQFNSIEGIARNNLARLNSDGSLDATFNVTIGGKGSLPGLVYSMVEQEDGKLLIGGRFAAINGVLRNAFARLNEDGTLDASFGDIQITPLWNGTELEIYTPRVTAVLQQPDGKILLGGEFSKIGNNYKTRLARLNADGSLDMTFTPSPSGYISSFTLQEDGKIFVTGRFTVARLNPDGTLDADFIADSDHTVFAMVLDKYGKPWIGGQFAELNGLKTQGVAKLENGGSGTSLTIGTSSAFWETPETTSVLRDVSFEISSDGGVTWTPLGAPAKVSGGWQLDNLNLPEQGFLRAKGYGMTSNRSASVIEDIVLFGRQPSKLEQWRLEQFGALTNQRTGSDAADADRDGVKNLMEYAFALSPWEASSAALPQWSKGSAQHELSFTRPVDVEGISYVAQWSSTMQAGDWHDVSNLEAGENYRFVIPHDQSPKKFFRLKVSNP